MSLVEKRYARAAFELAEEKHTTQAMQKDLAGLQEIWEEHKDLRAFLTGPQNSLAAKKQALRALFSSRVGEDSLRLLLLLADKGRIGLIPGICREFDALADASRHILNIRIETAAPLDQSETEAIGEKFRARFNALKVKAQVKIDPSLIGGVRVIAGDRLFDGSVKGRLEKLQTSLGLHPRGK